MAISAKDVKRLRDATGVGMLDCKKALEATDGDFDAAVDLLRKKGQKVAAKRADKEASEGLVVAKVDSDHSVGALVEVNCETDFVARNDEFQQFVDTLADIILAEQPEDQEALEALPFSDGKTVGEKVIQLTGKIGEKIEIARFDLLKSEGGSVVSYIHPGSRLAVLVDIHGNGSVEDAGRDVAMQVAALSPIATTVDEVDQEVKEKEKEIARENARNEGKPDHIIERIAEGKLDRFFKDNVLVEQPFVKDSSKTVREMLDAADVDVKSYIRYALGE